MRARMDRIELATLPLDVLRSLFLRLVGRTGRSLLSDRTTRVAAYALFGLLTSLVLALAFPVWAFALGPIVLGVPHLLADVRYLVVRPSLHRRTLLMATTAIPLVLATFNANPGIGLAAGFGAIAFSKSDLRLRVLLLCAWTAVVYFAAAHERVVQVALVHGHNLIALVLFACAFARSRRLGITITIGAIVLAGALLAGVFDSVIFGWSAHASGPKHALEFYGIVDTLVPVAIDPKLAVRLTVLFIFAQGLHYVIWLRVVPEEARERPGIRSFASSLRALDRDVGKIVLVLGALAAVVVAARAAVSLEAARVMYLRAAAFHAYLEIAFGLLLFVEGRKALARDT
jgi:hypothetical protein